MGRDALTKMALELASLIEKFIKGPVLYNPFHPEAVKYNRKKWGIDKGPLTSTTKRNRTKRK